MKFTDTLGHFCVRAAHLHVHPQPEFYTCNACSDEMPDAKVHMTDTTVAKTNARQADGSVTCPGCGDKMEHSGPRHFGELHVDLCLDETAHYPEKLAAGEITREQYQAWVDTLSDREKAGHYNRVDPHHMVVRLNHAEVDLMDKDPDAFQKLLHSKLESRLELDAHFTIQHRYKHATVKVTHLLKEFKK